MANQYSNEFKEDAVNYVKDHPELSVATCAKNLGINVNTLHGWLHKVREGSEFRGQGNYKSDKDKEIARLKRELRDATDALEILKKTLKIINE